QPASVRRSAATGNGSAPTFATASRAAARFSAEDEASTHFAPSRAKATAIARPMPRLPPVTTTTLLENSPGISLIPSVFAHNRAGEYVRLTPPAAPPQWR